MTIIKIKDITHSPYAVFPSSAKALLKELLYFIPFKRNVILSFQGITIVTSLFIRDSLEVLYKQYKKDADSFLILEDISNEIWRKN